MAAVTKFPCNAKKQPMVTGWQNYKGEVRSSIYGIVIPEGIIVIDVDTYKGVTLEQVEHALGCTPDWNSALLQTTMHGGQHFGFLVNNAENLAQGSDMLGLVGLDTRVSGKGYIATGNGYEDMTILGIDSAFESLDLPVLPEEAVRRLRIGAANDASNNADDDDVSGLEEAIAGQPLDISFDEVRAHVELLTDDDAADQDTWLKVGIAISHQTGNSNEGWLLFDEFSKRCAEKYNREANLRRWKSFPSNRDSRITFASIIAMTKSAKKIADVVSISQEIRESIENSVTVSDLKKQLDAIATGNLGKIELESLIKRYQSKNKELTGDLAPVGAIRSEITALKKEAKTRDKTLGSFVHDYVFLTTTAEYCDRHTKATMGPRAFDVKHSRETPPNGDGDKQSATVYSNDIIETVHDTMYFPKAGEIFTHAGKDYLNNYVPSDLIRVDVGTTDVVERVKGHIAHLLTDPREQEILIQYLAHNVQFPGEKLQWAIVLQGVQGDGKSFFAEMMQLILGFDNVRIMNVQTLESSFTGWAEGQCMTFIEELKLDNYRKYDVLNNLKPYISNGTVEVRALYKNSRSVLNTTNYIALTNFQDAIPVDPNDRRYCVLFSQWQDKRALEDWMRENPTYYPDIYQVMRDNAGELAQWLKEYPISDEFKATKRAPHTAAKDKMSMLSKSSDLVAVEDALEEFASQITNHEGEIDVTELKSKVRSDTFGDGAYENFPKDKRLANIMNDLGYECLGRKSVATLEGFKKHTMYKKR